MTTNGKPTVLLVSDSAHLDTGFGRVAREIGTGLLASGQFNVEQLGWFHSYGDKIVPFRIHTTLQSGQPNLTKDAYGEQSYQGVVDKVRPDLVIALGDEWMVKHMAVRPRRHKFVGYVPIDSAPLKADWINTFKAMDRIVLFGPWAEGVLRQENRSLKVDTIAHGVDTKAFHPMVGMKRALKYKFYKNDEAFVVGTVARNSPRKMLPRLVKAFRYFINPSTSCETCGHIETSCVNHMRVCTKCGSKHVRHMAAKDNCRLYLHSVANDPAGHDLASLADRFGLLDVMDMPMNMQVGKGVTDSVLNEIYNSFDVFTLPTGGEGWGLPILEAMAAGLPVLVTDYSAHTDYVRNAGELIMVNDWITSKAHNGEHALVAMDDYVMKLDRMYYDADSFRTKWGPLFDSAQESSALDNLMAGESYRAQLGHLAHERAQNYQWGPIVEDWRKLACEVLGYTPDGQANVGEEIQVEVI